MTTRVKVEGLCPMGCGPTLVLGLGGHVTCSYSACPAPDRVTEILSDGEHEHIVELGPSSFNLQHPLKERGTDLFKCNMHARIARQGRPGEPPAPPGRYRVVESADGLSFEPLGV